MASASIRDIIRQTNGFHKNMIADHTESQKETILRIGINGASSVLDVGCGDGEKTFYIAQHVNWSVGIDPDENLIRTARNRYDGSNLIFQVAQAESLCFSNLLFDSVLFNESLHHVAVGKQLEALKESHRVLKPEGKLLVTEPIHGSGSFGQISKLYNNEEEQKQNAIKAIESVINAEFKLSLEREIGIECHFKGFDDFYAYSIFNSPCIEWDEDYKEGIMDRLRQYNRDPESDFTLDYSAFVWLLIKK